MTRRPRFSGILPVDFFCLLRCPLCRGELLETCCAKTELLTCQTCLTTYAQKDGVLDLRPKGFSSEFVEWQRKLQLHERWWRTERRTKSMRSVWSPDAEFIDRYLALGSVGSQHGWILDVGCGEGHRRGHFLGKRYAGIDPLVLLPVYDFPFVRGVAEALPLASQSVDVVISVEALDHFGSPKDAASEMIRVLKPGGAVFVFIRDEQRNAELIGSESKAEPDIITEQAVHTHSFSPDALEALFASGFKQFVVQSQGDYQAAWGWQKHAN